MCGLAPTFSMSRGGRERVDDLAATTSFLLAAHPKRRLENALDALEVCYPLGNVVESSLNKGLDVFARSGFADT